MTRFSLVFAIWMLGAPAFAGSADSGAKPGLDAQKPAVEECQCSLRKQHQVAQRLARQKQRESVE